VLKVSFAQLTVRVCTVVGSRAEIPTEPPRDGTGPDPVSRRR
jgi:hypothetical protein